MATFEQHCLSLYNDYKWCLIMTTQEIELQLQISLAKASADAASAAVKVTTALCELLFPETKRSK
jgi:hypothetical protein